jgi:hypothetical protein
VAAAAAGTPAASAAAGGAAALGAFPGAAPGAAPGAGRGAAFGASPRAEVSLQALSVAEDFGTLLRARRGLVLSVSSFSWWAAALGGAARPVVVPACGLMLRQLWRPAPRLRPGLLVAHDLTLPRLGGPSAAAEASRASFLAAFEGGEGAGARAGVVEVPLAHLPRWPGNTAAALESLFD